MRCRLTALLIASSALLGAGPAFAAAPLAPADEPAALPARFAEALNLGPAGDVCTLLVDELRADLASREAAGLNPYDPATWTPAGLARGCAGFVQDGDRRYLDGPSPDRTTVPGVRVVAQRDGVAHLRVQVEKHVDDPMHADTRITTENVFAERGVDGTWRLAWVGRLLHEFSSEGSFVILGDGSEELIVPRTLRDYPAFRRQQIRIERLQLAERRREARAFSAGRTPIETAPRSCAGTRMPGRLARAGGIRSATLRVEPRDLYWTLRLAGPLPARLGLETDADQRVRSVRVGSIPRLLGAGARLGVQLGDGTAAGWVAGGNRQTFTRVRASASGRTLVVRMPRRALHGRIEARRPFRWKLATFPVGAPLAELEAADPPASAAADDATPEQVLRQFVADAFTLRRTQACELLATDLRTLHFAPSLFTDEPNWHDPASYTPEAIAANCDRTVAVVVSRTLLENSTDLRAVRLLRVVQRAVRGDRAHLRVRARGVAAGDGIDDRDTRILTDVFLVREDGAWRLAFLGALSDMRPEGRGDEDGTRRERWWRWHVARPTTLRHLDGHLRLLARDAARARGERDARLRAMTAARSPIAAEPVACAGASSTLADPPNDVRWASGHELVDDQAAPGDDVRAATLWLDGPSLCLEVRLRTPVPPRLSVRLGLDPRNVGGGAEASLALDDGVAYVLRENADEGVTYIRPEASVTGDALRMRVPVAALRDPAVVLGRPLEWTVTTFQANPVDEPVSDHDTWMDDTRSATLR